MGLLLGRFGLTRVKPSVEVPAVRRESARRRTSRRSSCSRPREGCGDGITCSRLCTGSKASNGASTPTRRSSARHVARMSYLFV